MKLKYGLFLVFAVLITACLEKKEILEVSTHPTGWMLQSSDNFHGKAVKSSELQNPSGSCQTCHGDNYDGGASQVSCYDAQCHATYPHPEGMLDFTSENFHGNFIRERVNWDIIVCQDCHGADYAGMGDQDKNCTKCHSQADGPEACNTCHGSSTSIAPPEDLLGNEETTSIGVGAHQSHLTESELTTAYTLDCAICHVTPAIFDMDGHVDDSSPNAELNFNDFAATGDLSPHWDRDAATCSNVYCHGAFSFSRDSSQYAWIYTDSVITGNYSNDVVWNSVGTNQAACGTCHGLPPEGHFAAITECGNCHYHIGEGLEILDKELHINGKIEVY